MQATRYQTTDNEIINFDYWTTDLFALQVMRSTFFINFVLHKHETKIWSASWENLQLFKKWGNK